MAAVTVGATSSVRTQSASWSTGSVMATLHGGPDIAIIRIVASLGDSHQMEGVDVRSALVRR